MDLWEIFKASGGMPIRGDMLDAFMGSSLGGGSALWETENAPYLFRQSGGVLNSRLLGKEKDTLVGASVGWNQLVNSGDTSVTVTSGHKYYANINNSKTIGSSNGSAISINDSTKDNVVDLTLMLGSAIADYAYTLESGTAGAGIAWLKSYGFFDKPYYAYDSGSIKSVGGLSAHKMVGKNRKINDGLNYIGEYTGITVSYDSDTQEYTLNGTTLNPGNIDLVRLPKETLSFLVGKSVTMSVLITGGSLELGEGTGITYGFALFNTNASGYLRGTLTNEQIEDYTATTNNFPDSSGDYTLMLQCWRVGSVFNNLKFKIMIEQGNTATDYAPYHADTYALDSSITLRGLFKMDADHNIYAEGDIYEADGTVTRKYGIVDLGSLDWTYYNGTYKDYFRTTNEVVGLKPSADNNAIQNIKSSKYITDTWVHTVDNASYDKCICVGWGGKSYIAVADTAYSDKDAFKTAMNGVYLVYELATPTTDTAEPFASPQNVDKAGTEEYVTTDKFVPVGHSTEYKVSAI